MSLEILASLDSSRIGPAQDDGVVLSRRDARSRKRVRHDCPDRLL